MKNNRGVTLITMVITIIVMLILTTTILFSVTNRMSSQMVDNLYSDLTILRDKVNLYYLKYGKLPLGEEYITISQIPTNILNPNDEGSKYYVIDVNAIENLSLNNANDIYVINEGTHTIYYPSGVEYEGVTYYRLPEEYTKIELDGLEPTT